MKKKPLANKAGKVREFTQKDINTMQPANKALPAALLDALSKRKRGQRGPPTKRWSLDDLENEIDLDS